MSASVLPVRLAAQLWCCAEIPDDGRVLYDEPYLSTYEQWEAPQEAHPAVPHR